MRGETISESVYRLMVNIYARCPLSSAEAYMKFLVREKSARKE